MSTLSRNQLKVGIFLAVAIAFTALLSMGWSQEDTELVERPRMFTAATPGSLGNVAAPSVPSTPPPPPRVLPPSPIVFTAPPVISISKEEEERAMEEANGGRQAIDWASRRLGKLNFTHVEPKGVPHLILTHEQLVKRVNSELAIALLTTAKFLPRLKPILETWWNTSESPDLVTIWSDSENQTGLGFHIPNLRDSKCESSYNYGLWCKNIPMVKEWRTNPKYRNVKWFFRGTDDTYMHLENTLHLLDQYDHREPLMIGDRLCSEFGYEYPAGGSGFFLSRGFLDVWDSQTWTAPCRDPKRNRGSFFDDVMWGEYMHKMDFKQDGKPMRMIHHHGISQAAFAYHSPIYNYYKKFMDGENAWPFPYRIVTVHHHGSNLAMKEIHDVLHNIRYHPVADVLVPIEPCNCPGGKHQRCNYDQAQLERTGKCKFASDEMQCYSRGPWPLL